MGYYSNLLLGNLLFKVFNRKKQVNRPEEAKESELFTEEEEEAPEEEADAQEEKAEASASEQEDPDAEYEVIEREILPTKIICPECGGITLEGLEFCDKCGGELP